MNIMELLIEVVNLSKIFTLHVQGGARIEAFEGLNLKVFSGQCLALNGPSGAGKSTLLRSLYANYMPQDGRIWVKHGRDRVDMVTAPPRRILQVRHETIGFVSQFLRVIPRVSTLNIVTEPLRRRGVPQAEAQFRAENILTRLNIPQRLWPLAPATFSGGEQQRVNVARSFVVDYPILLLDEPTASLDVENRNMVVDLIRAAKQRGAGIVGIFHDPKVREAVADRIYEMKPCHKK